jgi:hypothetical protein
MSRLSGSGELAPAKQTSGNKKRYELALFHDQAFMYKRCIRINSKVKSGKAERLYDSIETQASIVKTEAKRLDPTVALQLQAWL